MLRLSLRLSLSLSSACVLVCSCAQYYITSGQQFTTLPELVAHHSQHPDGLVCTLLYPAPKRGAPRLYSTASISFSSSFSSSLTHFS